MSGFLEFARARLAERSSRVQLVMLALVALVLAGLVTMEQIDAWIAKIAAVIAVAGPMAGVLIPDPAKAPDAEALARAAEALIERDPRFAAIRERVEDVQDAVGPVAEIIGQALER